MILSKMTGITLDAVREGGCYYKDDKGVCWYEYRNALLQNKPVIVVDQKTREIVLMYQGSDPTKVGLFKTGVYDVYQLDSFPVATWREFAQSHYKFDGKQVVLVGSKIEPEKPRTKEDIWADLQKLQAELSALK